VKFVENREEELSLEFLQLPRGSAHLRQALSKYLSPSFKRGRELDPNTEIQVTAGANEGESIPGREVSSLLILHNRHRPRHVRIRECVHKTRRRSYHL